MAKKYFTCGVAPFAGGSRTLKRYVKTGLLGPVARIADGNNTPLLTPEQVTRANKIHRERSLANK